jgi:hypothetical protein
MATDFSFNGQTSYSPLLSAVSQAPYDAAKLKILQEENQRARLSSLLSNMASAAAIARQIQITGQESQKNQGIKDIQSLMTEPNQNQVIGNANFQPQSGVQGKPSMFPQGTPIGTPTDVNATGDISAQPFQPSTPVTFGQTQQGQTQPARLLAALTKANPQSMTENMAGISGILASLGGGGQSAKDIPLLQKKLGQEWELKPSPENGKMTAYPKYQGMGGAREIPTDVSTQPGTSTLNPVANQALGDQVKSLTENPQFKKAQETLSDMQQIEAMIKANNAAGLQQILIQRAESQGLTAGRLNAGSIAKEFGNQSIYARIWRAGQRAVNGQLMDLDKTEMLDQLNIQRKTMGTQVLGIIDNQAKGFANRYKLPKNDVKQQMMDLSGISPALQGYDPNYKPIYQTPKEPASNKTDKSTFVPSSSGRRIPVTSFTVSK